MKLRKLELKDAPLMLEWMHNPSVVKNMQTDFVNKTLFDCENFIACSEDDEHNLHLAIVDDADIYMGTASLKNIENSEAEFAITIRECAMGRGYSKYAMIEILRIGLEELKLKRIYWCVAPENERALKFYDKNGYERISIDKLKIGGGSTQYNNFSITSGTRKHKKVCKKKKENSLQFNMFYPCFLHAESLN